MTKFKPLIEELQGALIRFAQAFLYFGPHAYRMKFIEKENVIPEFMKKMGAKDTMGIDKFWRVYYNPEYVKSCTPKQNVFNIYHEICHPLLGFWERIGNRDQTMFNMAHDLEINSGRMKEIQSWQPGPRNVECPMELPPGVLTPDVFGFPHGLLAEEYYELLMQFGEENAKKKCKQNGCQPCHAEPGEGDSGEQGRISPAEGEIMKRKIAEDLEEHKKARGFLPGDLQFFVERTLRPVVNWKKELRAATRHALIITQGKTDYTYRKRSRREIPGIVMPGMQDHMPVACVGQDTSGSMDDHDIDRGMTELAAILNLYRNKFFVHFLAVDAVIQKKVKLFSAAQPVPLGGRGGTDMVRFFDEAMELKPKPDVLILVTDGETPWPAKAPAARTIIICTTNAETPSWAKTVRVGEGER